MACGLAREQGAARKHSHQAGAVLLGAGLDGDPVSGHGQLGAAGGAVAEFAGGLGENLLLLGGHAPAASEVGGYATGYAACGREGREGGGKRVVPTEIVE